VTDRLTAEIKLDAIARMIEEISAHNPKPSRPELIQPIYDIAAIVGLKREARR